MREKLKNLRGFLITAGITALVSALLAAYAIVQGESILIALSVPFVLIGRGLRALSLSGGVGNAFAIIFYVLVSLVPAAVAVLFFVRDKKLTPAKILLVALTGYSFAVFYFLVNPGAVRFIVDLPDETREGFLQIVFTGCAFVYYGLLLLALCLRALGRAKRGDGELARLVKALFAFAGGLILFMFLGTELPALCGKISCGGADGVLGAVAFLLHGGLYGLLFAAAALAYGGVDSFRSSLYERENVLRLRKISRLCIWAFFGGIACCVLVNLLVFACVSRLQKIEFEFVASVSLAVIAAGCALASKLLARTIELHEENVLTI